MTFGFVDRRSIRLSYGPGIGQASEDPADRPGLYASGMNSRSALRYVLALMMLLAGPQAAERPRPAFNVQASKKADGPYLDERQTATVNEGKTKLFFWKVEETDGNADSMLFDDAATGDSDDGYKVQWYKGKKPKASRKISSDVKGVGYEFNLTADKSKYFTAKVTVQDESETLCLGGQASNDTPTFDQAYFDVNGFCT